MPTFIERLTEQSKNPYFGTEVLPVLEYVKTGDETVLAQMRKAKTSQGWWGPYWLRPLWEHLESPETLSEEEKRAMRGIVAIGAQEQLSDWLKNQLKKRPSPEENFHAILSAAIGKESTAIVQTAIATLDHFDGVLEQTNGCPNSAGRFLLSLSDQQLVEAGKEACTVRHGLGFLLRHAPERVPKFATSFLHVRSSYRPEPVLDSDCCELLLTADKSRYEALVVKVASAEKECIPRARAWRHLAVCDAKTHLAKARELNLSLLADDDGRCHAVEVSEWLVEIFGAKALPDLVAFLGNTSAPDSVITGVVQILVETFGELAAACVIAAASNPNHLVRLDAISYLMSWPAPTYDAVIQTCLENGLDTKDSADVVRYISAAGRWQPARLAERLWKLFEHKSKPVRQAAARALAKSGDEAVARASGLLEAKKAIVRSSAVLLLTAIGSQAAAEALAARLDLETDEEVRDQILLGLESAWESQGRKITPQEINARIERTAEKLNQPVVNWLAEKQLPDLFYAGASKEALSREAVRYLLYRQSRSKEMRADVEAKALYALVDRKSSGDFSLSLLQQFFASPMAAEDRWALVVAGLLGDDRVVSALMQQIRKWVDSNRGKLAEYATQALALLGSDVALCAVDSLSIRYRSKQKNIGKAASEAFAEAAERLGISVDELGDRVVPWLGFVPCQPRLIEAGDKRIEIRLGQDFKLEFRDLTKGKKIASLPAGVTKEVKDEFKELGVTLREVLKGQLSRIENLMVRQHRWPLARWRELFVEHPLLFPFACRLVWSVVDDDGKRLATFRALEDRTLTNQIDETVELPVKGQVGIVHPLELTADQRQAWAQHLADYNIQSPFLQLERSVVLCPQADRSIRFSSQVKGKEVNAITFKGRSDRLGWQRGSVCDGGGISSYRKCFAGAGADAILELEGMYIGIDMYTGVQLGRLCFVKSGSVSIGSYTYDEPTDEKDDRLLPFGEVPPIVYSETLGDLAKIAGTGKDDADA